MEEVWRDIPIEPFTKERISSFGRVHLRPSKFNPAGKVLGGSTDGNGYRLVTLCTGDGIRKQFKVHRLVAIAFLDNPNNLPQVNHKNGDKADNRLENLEWCTASENQAHAIKIGLRSQSPWTAENIGKAARGSRHGNSKLTEKDVLEMRRLHRIGTPIRKLAFMYEIGRCAVWEICTRKRWTHI